MGISPLVQFRCGEAGGVPPDEALHRGDSRISNNYHFPSRGLRLH